MKYVREVSVVDSNYLAQARNGFASLKVEDWRQFDSVEMLFHPRLTVLTGANATGKSTLLGILARHFNFHRTYSSAPVRLKSSSGEWVSVGRRRARRLARERSYAHVGTLSYVSGAKTDIQVPPPSDEARASQYDLILADQQRVEGVYITSHRASSAMYAPVQMIPTAFPSPADINDQFVNELRNRWQGGWSGKPPQSALKEILIAAAVFSSRQNALVQYSAEAEGIWHGFQQVMHAVMPSSLGYRGMKVRSPDLIIESATGDFLIDDASGGLAAIMELSWTVFLQARVHGQFTLLMDEPENHLHPSLQREFLPNLLRAFPHVQFIVATHSPFIVTASPDSSVYALQYNSHRRVEARQLDYANKASNADETLRDVLGVGSTIPPWAEEIYDVVLSKFPPGTLTDSRLLQLRRELTDIGLEERFPEAVLQVVDGDQARRADR